jgi:hypothetical protein
VDIQRVIVPALPWGSSELCFEDRFWIIGCLFISTGAWCAGSAQSSKGRSDDDADLDDGAMDTNELAAETQRILRGEQHSPSHSGENPHTTLDDVIVSQKDVRDNDVAADAARSDRIGKGAAPEIQPLSGVLAKIMQRKEEAISR